MNGIEFLDQLNPSQREAVMQVEGPLMVIAGAGSGKTRVLTYRLAFILSQGLADPPALLALTFTNKAAKEMRERINRLVGPEAKGIMMGTFHSIFARVLRVEAERLGYTRNFTIYDSDDSKALVRALLKEQNFDDKTYKPNVIRNVISAAKTKMILPEQFKQYIGSDFDEKAAVIYELYEKRLFQSNAMDFDDLLLRPLQMFNTFPDLLHKYQHRFKYIMVDEYQDTNQVQYLLCKHLAAVHENLCVVGDDAQSIYAFRGANIQNILNFKRDYEDVVEIKLEQNYRSTQNIVNAANSIIEKNRDQIKKRVFTENEEGELINLIAAISEQDEALRVTNLIREQKQILNFFNKDFAVLYRTNAQSRAIEDSLRRANIPYRIYGGLSFYQRKEIKDLVAYLKLAINPRDEQALLRVINYPKRGIGKSTIDRLVVAMEENNTDLWTVLQNVQHAGVGNRPIGLIREFTTMIERFGVEAQRLNAYEAANFIAKQSTILKTLHSSNDAEDLSRWENVQELLNAAQQFGDTVGENEDKLENFLAEISLFTDADRDDQDNDKVNLMTIHSAKGLEFKSVFVVGMEENIFPSGMVESRADLEEERRLFYVATTRAEKRLTLSFAKSRYRYGQINYNEPSRFLEEMDPKFLKLPQRLVGKSSDMPTPTSTEARQKQRIINRQKASESSPAVPDSFEPSDPDEIRPGHKVLHLKFGTGKVLAVESVGSQKKATVFFDSKGQKVLLLKYAKLQILT
ncbi:MAG: 3'-5' exonuclease [Bacteroidia bacterium]